MRVALLGPVRVFSDDGSPVEIGGPRVRMVAACLALAPGRAVSAESLIDGVWGSDVPGGAANAVQAAVSRLRKALRGVADVDSAGGGYRFSVARQEVDAWCFGLEAACADKPLPPDCPATASRTATGPARPTCSAPAAAASDRGDEHLSAGGVTMWRTEMQSTEMPARLSS